MDRTIPLFNRIAARYPLLDVVTPDAHDARRVVADAAKRAGLGLLAPRFGRRPVVDAGCDAIAELLAQQGRHLVIIPAGQHLLGDATFVQLLTESLPDIERHGHCVVLLSAVRRACPQLDRERVVLELGLPSDAELRELVTAALTGDDGVGPSVPVVQQCLQAARGMTRSQLRRALRRLRLGRDKLDEGDIAALHAEKRDLIAHGGVLEVASWAPTLEDIGGMDTLKSWLGRRRRALGEEARTFGLPAPRGLLLVGVQGCGKSLFAKATAQSLGLPLLRFDLGRLFTRDSAPEENLRNALAIAGAMAPVVLWVDEIDKAFAGAAAGSDVTARIFGTFLTWLAEHPDGVFVAATANRVDHLPAELMRKGRFDETFFVDLPDTQVREEILAIHLRRSGRDPERFDLEGLAKAAKRLTGAELEQAVVEALAVAFEERRGLLDADLERALGETVPFVETYEEQVKALREWARRRARSAGQDRSLRDLFVEAQGGGEAWRP
ncbi:MAG: AAA family ATPase [Myxococcales bacterium]|nr:AAA family ATPase [Myxococcales bacterium]